MTKQGWVSVPDLRRSAVRADADLTGGQLVHCGRCRRWIAIYIELDAAIWLRNGKGHPLFFDDSFKEGTLSVRCKRCRRVTIIDSKTGEVLRTVDS